jgi:regulator of protease activity HflC (stomatin/prohibitin superfamily)
MSFVHFLAVVVACVGFVLYTMRKGIHTVPEGYISVYWRAGKLLNSYGEAGVNLMIPYLDSMEKVQVTLQTDRVNNIPCGTSGGVILTFSAIEVVNRLSKASAIEIIRNYGVEYDKTWIFDKIHHEINQFCSSHSLQEVYIDLFSTLDESLVVSLQSEIDKYAPGLQILSVRVTKPQIPHSIQENYASMEAEKTRLLVAVERAKVERQSAETEKMKAEIAAQRAASVSLIDKERLIKEKEAEQKIMEIEDVMFLNREKAHADAAFYHSQKKAEANRDLFTPEYIQYTFAQALANNTKVYFGNKIPSILLENTFQSLTTQQVEQTEQTA